MATLTFLPNDFDLDNTNAPNAYFPLAYIDPLKLEDHPDTDDDAWDDYPQVTNAHNTPTGNFAGLSIANPSRSPSPPPTIARPRNSKKVAAHPPAHPSVAALNPASLVARVASSPILSPSSPSSPAAQQAKLAKKDAALPHPYAISPTNTTALFTRASSVGSNLNGKKSRAPPSGPICVKDFVPPDVSGLSKREARLVKNRAAAFLSRQRKREEFEGLETRVDILKAENKRLHEQLAAYLAGNAPELSADLATASSATDTLHAEVAGLRRAQATRDVELASLHTRIRAHVSEHDKNVAIIADRDREIEELRAALAQAKEVSPAATSPSAGVPANNDEYLDESDSDRSTPALEAAAAPSSKSSVAVMALLVSLGALLKTAHPSAPSSYNMGFNDFESNSDLIFASPTFDASYHGFGLGLVSGLSDASAFASLAYNAAVNPAAPACSAPSVAPIAPAAPTPAEVTKAVSGLNRVSDNEFEFDYALDAGEKVKVTVKSAFPMDVAFPAPSTASNSNVNSNNASPAVKMMLDDDLSPAPAHWEPLPASLLSPASKKRKHDEQDHTGVSQRRRISEDELMFSSDLDFDLLAQQEDSKDWFLNLGEDDVVIRS